MKCLICNYISPNNRGLSIHIKLSHEMNSKTYYDKYLKKPNEDICIVCGKPTQYLNISVGYREVCSISCGQKNPKVRAKIESTNMNKYGKSTPLITEESLNKSHSKEAMDKKRKTMINTYGYANSFCTEATQKKCQETMIKRHGSNNPMVCNKNIFKKYNGTRSSYEQLLKESLEQHNINFMYEYNKDSRYPYFCDFYLPDSDTFVEINGYWMHGGHWFDETNQKDIDLLNQWKEKAKTSTRLQAAINVWTHCDIEKRTCAKNNKLNYVVLWSKQDILDWIKSNFQIRHDY